ncbi:MULTISPECIES: hypothetical protein [Saccharopolyspora]|uniref:Holin n=1 Tax=Saccharopolyspora gregorii TaxID=33914 RepID=A0ABP6RPR5_9PSEU|nr:MULTISPECIES: hypothetical protein [Saccharopolyspora]MCA1186841.1 hypothetical protein [Saccharopolyspora sp. 6T]MCA1190929.1 hypothetical protein [Saccharopolyspora sp. 6V]MCA1225583.1 hypothetical protein [Saccharopolyspora sp. 6M]MCA1278744.1 hypothetical protein [Saccharopolyspora sp. 7B]
MNQKLKAAFQLASVLSAAYGLRASLREAKANGDRLAMADSIITALGLITGTALAIRTLRKGEDGQ